MADLAIRALPTSGLGTRCAEAQADGVPCPEMCDCETCGRAAPFFTTPVSPDTPPVGTPAVRRPHA